MTITATLTRTDCPTWCRRHHDEGPLETVIHEDTRADIHSRPEPNDRSTPAVGVALAQVEDEPTYVLVGDHMLTARDTEQLIAELRARLVWVTR